MTRDELWEQNYNACLDFLTKNKKRPSKHRMEEHQMLNWIKYQKKRLAQEKMQPHRRERFKQLLELSENYLRKNQYAYATPPQDGFCGNFFDQA